MATEYTEKDVLLTRQQRVVDFIAQEYPDDEINQAGEVLWLAMQTICSPSGAAWIITCAQVK